MLCLHLPSPLTVMPIVSGEGSSAQFREESFKKRAISIKKYVDENKDLQLRVLYALQIAVAHLQHPPGETTHLYLCC